MRARLQPQIRRLLMMRSDPDNPDEVPGVLNPAAARVPDGTLFLLPRVVAAGNYSPIRIARAIFTVWSAAVCVRSGSADRFQSVR